MKALIRILLAIAGTLCVGLGILGMFLPVLPTTPFLLLAAVCFARGSPRLYEWLMTNRWCGEYIRNYREGRGIALRQKVVTIVLLWLTISYGALFVVPIVWVKVLLFAIATGVTIHLARIKTYRPESCHNPVPPDGKRLDQTFAGPDRLTQNQGPVVQAQKQGENLL